MKEPLTVLHEITPRHGGRGRAGPPMWHLPQQFCPWPHHHAPSAASWVAFIFAGNLDHGFPERVWALGKPAGPPARSLGPQERGAGRRLQAEPAGMHQGQGPADAHGFFHWAGRQHRQPPGSKDPTLPDSRTDSANTLVQTHLQRAPSCLNRPPTPQAPGSVLCRSPPLFPPLLCYIWVWRPCSLSPCCLETMATFLSQRRSHSGTPMLRNIRGERIEGRSARPGHWPRLYL